VSVFVDYFREHENKAVARQDEANAQQKHALVLHALHRECISYKVTPIDRSY